MSDSSARPSAVGWLRRLEARECSARELLEQSLDRIQSANPSLNAAIAIDQEGALEQADRADRERGDHPGRPLLGLPITVKDSLDVAGWRTTAGSLARPEHRAGADATAIARLRAAGAIVIAKTNCPECSASYETDNAIYGRTNNPFDLSRTAGGSSGGEAALLGADASIVGVGADGGGSIRVPSHCCGIFGLRPSTGRVPETGVWPPTRPTGMMDMLCVGPMARYAEDLELLLPVMAGADGVDPYAPPIPIDLDLEDGPPGRPLEVGYYLSDPLTAPSVAVRDAVEGAARALAEAGHRVDEVQPPPTEQATELFFGAVAADGGMHLKDAVAGADGRHHPQFASLLQGLPESSPSAEDFFELARRLFAFRARIREFVWSHDLVLCPVLPGPAPRHGQPPAAIPKSEYALYHGYNFVHTYAVAGLPAASVPVASDAGLPLGVQVVSRPFREDLVLRAARVLERSMAGFRPPPSIDAVRPGPGSD